MPSTGPTAGREPQMMTQIMQLDKGVSNLEDAFDKLSTRLECIATKGDDPLPGSPEPEDLLVERAGRIRGLRYRVNNIVDRMSTLTESIEA